MIIFFLFIYLFYLFLQCIIGTNLYPAEQMGDFEPSLIIKLYQKGFSLGNQVSKYIFFLFLNI